MKSNIFKSEATNSRFIMEDTRDTRDTRDARPRDTRDTRDKEFRDRESFRGRREQETRIGSRNTFGGERVKQKMVQLNVENFPALSANVEIQTSEEKQEYGYASALNKAKDVDEDVLIREKVPSGWVRIKLDETSRRFIYEYGDSTYIQEELSLNDEMNAAIELMKERWMRHKENYIDLYGEDEYNRYYPQYIRGDSETDFDYEDIDY
jgi:hypothetical protein